MDIATLAGGCYWCLEAIYKRVKGVISVESGYCGGHVENPSYYEVVTGKTGHAESIQITFDPNIISYEDILNIFFELHDPTTLNRQGNDVGEQYRSVIFYHNEDQKDVALKLKQSLDNSKKYVDPIVTEIVQFEKFYPAEDFAKDYYDRNRSQMYCKIIIDPKIKKLFKEYSSKVKEEYIKGL